MSDFQPERPCETGYVPHSERANARAAEIRRRTQNFGLALGTLGPPLGLNRLQAQREAAYRAMMGVAAALQRSDYGVEADRVIDFIIERRDTGVYPEAYAAWLRDQFPPLGVEPCATEVEVEAVYDLVHERTALLRHS